MTGLKPCEACGHQISTGAIACPNCGHPSVPSYPDEETTTPVDTKPSRKPSDSPIVKYGGGCLLVFVLIGIWGALVDGNKPISPTISAPPSPPPPPVAELDPDPTPDRANPFANSSFAPSPAPSLQPTPQPNPDVRLVRYSWNADGDWEYIKGEVQNLSGQDLPLVKVYADFYDGRQQFIDSEWTYAELNPLPSGKSSPFEMMRKRNVSAKGIIIRFMVQEGFSTRELSVEYPKR